MEKASHGQTFERQVREIETPDSRQQELIIKFFERNENPNGEMVMRHSRMYMYIVHFLMWRKFVILNLKFRSNDGESIEESRQNDHEVFR